MTDTIETRVARGAALLDEVLPGWIDMIDLDRLNLESPCRCVLGQTWTGPHTSAYSSSPYFAHVAALFVDPLLRTRSAIDHGFNAGYHYGFARKMDDEYNALTDEWKRVILARRGGESS